VGLGTGTIAAYGRAGDVFRFYEINPGVIALSEGFPSFFTYLRDSTASIQIVEGDARLSLEREISEASAPRFDLLAVDAFTSDAIPVHLLTREALTIYLARLARPDGVLALHISNRQLDLEPVVQTLIASMKLPSCIVDRKSSGDAEWGTTWVLLAQDPRVLDVPPIKDACVHRVPDRTVRVWTDDYSNLFAVMK
jgi:hypothetical protein